MVHGAVVWGHTKLGCVDDLRTLLYSESCGEDYWSSLGHGRTPLSGEGEANTGAGMSVMVKYLVDANSCGSSDYHAGV